LPAQAASKSWAISIDSFTPQQEISDVTAHKFPLKTWLAALLFLTAGSLGARADDPTPAALDAARLVITSSGMTRSFDLIVPQMLGELEHNVTATRPELKDSLHAVLLALQPEFNKTEQEVIEGAARALARHMSEQELKDAANFFTSPSGKKYVEAEPLAFGDIVAIVQSWRQKLSTDVLARAREEMKKKGLDF
jgi:uncharacterized protein